MKINRTNYEEYFLLAIDRELDTADLLALETFVNENPDLRLEWEALNSSILTEENSISFTDKFMLQSIPQKEQILESLMLLLDNEVSTEQRLHTMQLIASDSIVHKEFNSLQNAKLTDVIEYEYPWKKELYKKEPRKLYPFYLRIAAAVIFIAATTFFYLANNVNNNSNNSFAGNTNSNTSEKKSTIKNSRIILTSPDRLPIETIYSSTNNKAKNTHPKTTQPKFEDIAEAETKQLPHLKPLSAIALQATESAPAINKEIASTALPTVELQNSSLVATKPAPAGALGSNLFFQEEENSPVEIFITDTNKRNKTRALVRKLVRFAGKAAELVTASANDENAIQIASFEIPRK